MTIMALIELKGMSYIPPCLYDSSNSRDFQHLITEAFLSEMDVFFDRLRSDLRSIVEAAPAILVSFDTKAPPGLPSAIHNRRGFTMDETGKRRRPPLRARPRPDADYRQISGQLSEALSVGFQYLADAERSERE